MTQIDRTPSYMMMMGNLHEGMSDHDFMHEEMRLAIAAEEMGYGTVWCVEHHFDGPYSMCPDNFLYLTHLAAKTSTIKIGIGACILPWNDPLRVSEKINLLDIMSGGRLQVGFGRGLSRKEYAGFGIDMAQARERWNEAYEMIARAQRTGVISGQGPHYPQPETRIAPFSGIPLTGRTTEIAMSEESQLAAARLGIKMASFTQFPMPQIAPQLHRYREVYEEANGVPAPPPMMVDMLTVHEDAQEAERLHREALGAYFITLMRHYELDGDHFAGTKSYESYDQMSKLFKEAGLDNAAEAYIQANTFGTPEQVLEKLRANLEVAGDYDLSLAFSLGGRPYSEAEKSMRLFADKCMPEWIKMRSQLLQAA